MDEKTPLERARDRLYEATELRQHAEAMERAARAIFEHERRMAEGDTGTVTPIRPEDPDE